MFVYKSHAPSSVVDSLLFIDPLKFISNISVWAKWQPLKYAINQLKQWLKGILQPSAVYTRGYVHAQSGWHQWGATTAATSGSMISFKFFHVVAGKHFDIFIDSFIHFGFCCGLGFNFIIFCMYHFNVCLQS